MLQARVVLLAAQDRIRGAPPPFTPPDPLPLPQVDVACVASSLPERPPAVGGPSRGRPDPCLRRRSNGGGSGDLQRGSGAPHLPVQAPRAPGGACCGRALREGRPVTGGRAVGIPGPGAAPPAPRHQVRPPLPGACRGGVPGVPLAPSRAAAAPATTSPVETKLPRCLGVVVSPPQASRMLIGSVVHAKSNKGYPDMMPPASVCIPCSDPAVQKAAALDSTQCLTRAQSCGRGEGVAAQSAHVGGPSAQAPDDGATAGGGPRPPGGRRTAAAQRGGDPRAPRRRRRHLRREVGAHRCSSMSACWLCRRHHGCGTLNLGGVDGGWRVIFMMVLWKLHHHIARAASPVMQDCVTGWGCSRDPTCQTLQDIHVGLRVSLLQHMAPRVRD